MRKAGRAIFLVFLGALSTAVFGVVTAVMAALSLAASTVLIVPGTGTPNANVVEDYMPHFYDRYIGGTDQALPAECVAETDCTLAGVNYPASFFPLFFFSGWCVPGRCNTWNDSVGTGVTNLNTALIDVLVNTDDDVILAGYSQGGAVVSNELRNLASLSPELKERLSVFVIGNAYNPDGGIFTRLGFLPTIPFLDITFGPSMPTDLGFEITTTGFEFDPVIYAPRYWLNPFAMINAFAAFQGVHGRYLTPTGNSSNPIAYGYTEEELAEILSGPCPGPNCRVDSQGNRYFMIPAKSLPIIDMVMQIVPAPLQPFFEPIVELVSPVLRVLIKLGYDWSGDPGETRWAVPLPFNPFQNWLAVGTELVEAVGEGIQNAFGIGAATMVAPPAEGGEAKVALAGDDVVVEDEVVAEDSTEDVAEDTAEDSAEDVAEDSATDEETSETSEASETEGTESEDGTDVIEVEDLDAIEDEDLGTESEDVESQDVDADLGDGDQGDEGEADADADAGDSDDSDGDTGQAAA
ncbi:PE-PPE domain-containing protein [Mycolicibacterium pulveris]|uniref:PE-PPE domain-containing protein n=1 Tax=Mycolicibacterium pulveris TaxID=36813 RepID=A0A7I7UGQ3_MYCPV|nr:PE-PPE domain-containing protein [Mycolicibacterium pulveris]MCV6978729.1 PE-PPE domain-containing protein [Mycolicibacterium pulveris]BBY80073.1 hypothetical protein MPUL_12310 [Mycolicibacterium pulveris]